jgi:histidinol-phosphate aminotransferase
VVLNRVDLRGRPVVELDSRRLSGVLPRAELDVAAAVELVRPMCEDVRERGAEAVREYTVRFDGVDRPGTLVPPGMLSAALAGLDPAVAAALRTAADRARRVHETQLPAESVTQVADGSSVTERYVPVRRAGVYVPGGLVVYPSSVVMNVIPAQVAGVSQIAVASPPQAEFGGQPHPAVLAACELLGITEVHAVGGAQAIAMLGYGTADCAAVDTITGPGNIYVAAAKRLLRGVVSIEAEAGPTEIAIVADASADARFVAADLIAQAEHDSLAACLFISTDAALADQVDIELDLQIATARHAARIKEALAGQSSCVLVDDLDAALAVADAWAPEHLEIQAADADGLARRVRNAGAIFVGPYAPVSLGDYLAGSNHVLPTGGTARHTAGLSVLAFLRGIHVVNCTKEALAEVAPHIDALGGAEDLAAHVNAVRVRIPGGEAGETSTEETAEVAEAVAAKEETTKPRVPSDDTPQCRPQGDDPLEPPLREDLRGRSPYGAPQVEARARLNTNENPYPPSPELVAAIAAAVAAEAAGLNRYPDRDAIALRGDLAAYLGHDLTVSQVWAANGSNEVIQQIFQAYGGPGRSALGFEPSYSMHPIIAKTSSTDWIGTPRADDFSVDADRALAAIDQHRPDLVFLTSPNNPTGTAMSLDVIEAVCQAAPGIVVIDEAYAEFARDTLGTALSLLPKYPRLIVTRTMSKAFALAGGRIGYLAADRRVVDGLQIVRLPYHLSSLTQVVGRVALAHSAELLANVASISADRDDLVAWFKENSFAVAESDTNFVLFGTFERRRAIWQALLDRGVLVREVGPPGWLRVSIGTPEENEAFKRALLAVLA